MAEERRVAKHRAKMEAWQCSQKGPREAAQLVPADEEDLLVLHVNIQGLVSHIAELAARIRLMPVRPHLICVNETFLDEAKRAAADKLEGYALIAERSRDDGWGGVVVYAKVGFDKQITLLDKSVSAERM